MNDIKVKPAESTNDDTNQKNDLMKAKKHKRVACILIMALLAFVIMIIVMNVIIPETNYYKAVSLLEAGDIIKAYEQLEELNGYKDSSEKAKEIFSQYKEEKLKTADVGDRIYFGMYEQDNDKLTREEDLEWIVVDKDGGKLFIMSKKAVDCKLFNTVITDITWEECSLRAWLNDTFFNEAFSADEQRRIIISNVTADNNPDYYTNPGNSTKDKVCLLSIQEVEKYLVSNELRQCVPTEYAKANGVGTTDDCKTLEGYPSCWWWLRSPGSGTYGAAFVDIDGTIDSFGYRVDGTNAGVRPAMWIDVGK